MAKVIISECDLCKAQELPAEPRAWDNRISPIVIRCPVDGINGSFEYDLCRSCRTAINVAINKAIEERGGV
mgnify:FL=1